MGGKLSQGSGECGTFGCHRSWDHQELNVWASEAPSNHYVRWPCTHIWRVTFHLGWLPLIWNLWTWIVKWNGLIYLMDRLRFHPSKEIMVLVLMRWGLIGLWSKMYALQAFHKNHKTVIPSCDGLVLKPQTRTIVGKNSNYMGLQLF